MSYIREITFEEPDGIGRNLTVLFLDLKLDYLEPKSKARAGIELAKSITSHMFIDKPTLQHSITQKSSTREGYSKSEPEIPIRLILSVNHVTDIELVNNFLHHLEQTNSSHLLNRIGFDVGMNDDIQIIESTWKRFGGTLNLWQGDGYTNCLSPFYNLERLSKALLKRDSVTGYPRKVYHWTIDLHDRMRESLKMGVDAVMTNHPERLLTILREPELAHDFRLATRKDDPFEKIIHRSSARSSESARYQRSTSPTNGGFIGNLVDVISSWFAYIKEIPFFSLPTTVRFMPKVKRHKSESTIISPADPRSEYRVLTAQTLSNSKTPATKTSGTSDLADSVDQILLGSNQQSVEKPFEGPRWYTSLTSNLLVSFLKIILPAG